MKPKQQVAPTPCDVITNLEWTQIVSSLKAKIKSPVTAGSDRESKDWRNHLREIKQAIVDGEQASLNAEDWTEIYYSIDAEESELLSKLGPDGCNMVTD
jgi:hypothetical protein